ncbi:mfs superfamily major facilitator transporter [Klebsiella oxytoca]|nr:mfs superfamily major facilitator transporter [Klebsiella oxytoca]
MAYQFGNGLTNLVSPTGGVLLAGLSIARIGFGQWLKAIAPLFPVLWIVSAVFCCDFGLGLRDMRAVVV